MECCLVAGDEVARRDSLFHTLWVYDIGGSEDLPVHRTDGLGGPSYVVVCTTLASSLSPAGVRSARLARLGCAGGQHALDGLVAALNVFLHEVLGRVGVMIHDRLHERSMGMRVARPFAPGGKLRPAVRSINRKRSSSSSSRGQRAHAAMCR